MSEAEASGAARAQTGSRQMGFPGWKSAATLTAVQLRCESGKQLRDLLQPCVLLRAAHALVLRLRHCAVDQDTYHRPSINLKQKLTVGALKTR